MATLEENIAQTQSDFDGIKEALEESGIDVPYDTDTSTYGNLVRQAVSASRITDQSYNPESISAQSGIAVAEGIEQHSTDETAHEDIREAIANMQSSPIAKVVSPDPDGNTVYLRDLESGSYVLSGAFKPYEGSGTVCRFSSDLLVNVVKGTLNKVPTSHIQIFYPVHNVVQFVDVTDETYKRTDIKLNDLAVWADVEELVQSTTKTIEQSANAIKANASGEVIRVDDVSPNEHTTKAKVGRKRNILPMPYYDKEKDINGVTLTTNEDGSITINGTSTAAVGFLIFKGSMPLKGNYTLSGVTNTNGDTSTHYLQPYIDEQFLTTVINGARTYEFNGNLTQLSLYVKAGFTFDNVVVYPQLEQGDTATEYEPYIDPTTVTVTRCGKNLWFPFITDQTFANGSYVKTYEDGSFLMHQAGDNIRYDYTMTLPAGEYCLSNGNMESTNNLPYLIVDYGEGNAYQKWKFTIAEPTECKLSVYGWREFIGDFVFYPLLERGTEYTEFEPCYGEHYTPNPDGTVDILSLSPTMTLLTDTEGANIDVEYNQDTNKAMGNVKADITTLDNDMAILKEDMGDVETALDNIIAIQNELMGVSE